jgi:hypothetical protein
MPVSLHRQMLVGRRQITRSNGFACGMRDLNQIICTTSTCSKVIKLDDGEVEKNCLKDVPKISSGNEVPSVSIVMIISKARKEALLTKNEGWMQIMQCLAHLDSTLNSDQACD